MSTHQVVIRAVTAAATVAVGVGIAVAPAAHADPQTAVAVDYVNRLSVANMDMSSAKQREVALLGGILACQLDTMGAAQPAGSEQYLAAAKPSGWCGLAAADATGLSKASTAISESITAIPAAAPAASSASGSCPAGFYPTDTDGVCVDTPPEQRPPHVATSDLPGPIFDIVEGGNQSAVERQFNEDGDAFNDDVDLAPNDPNFH
jgi:hypothetical protein